MKNIIRLFLFVIPFLVFSQKQSFEIKDGNFYLNQQKFNIHGGEMHYSRIPKEYWKHRLQMMKAMGLNTVTTYVFWNYHEEQPGKWDFTTDNKNLRAFIKEAQNQGLLVVLRPGPYVCAEWEFGGFPYWIQNIKGLKYRTNDDQFLSLTRKYFNRLGEEIKDLQITHGGPIILVQVENEFGSYVAQKKDIPFEEHKKYSAEIKKQLTQAGFDVPFFTSDASSLFKGGNVEGAIVTANGEDDVEVLKKSVHEFHNNQGPYYVAEFYPGWLDHWAEKFVRVDAQKVAKQTQKYIDNDVSFNFYMIHGGTNFGFTNGANYDKKHDLQPDITSYDYDAPITENGEPTEKYYLIRDILQKHSRDKFPDMPKAIDKIAIGSIKLNKSISLFDWIKNFPAVQDKKPMTFEKLNQPYGYVVYETKIPKAMKGKLKIPGLRDYALVFSNGKFLGELNRVFNKYELDIELSDNTDLKILVENLGRINYGANITENEKGIISPVYLDDKELEGWKMTKLEMQTQPMLSSTKQKFAANIPVLYEGKFAVEKIGDTFLDMQQWGKGIVFVNGHNLGRYWKVGPQQTLYLPGVWLKKKDNKILILEQLNLEEKSEISSLDKPILDKLKQ